MILRIYEQRDEMKRSMMEEAGCDLIIVPCWWDFSIERYLHVLYFMHLIISDPHAAWLVALKKADLIFSLSIHHHLQPWLFQVLLLPIFLNVPPPLPQALLISFTLYSGQAVPDVGELMLSVFYDRNLFPSNASWYDTFSCPPL